MGENQDKTEEGILSGSEVLCKGICRNGTNCLNKGKYQGYCRWHRNMPEKPINLDFI